MDKQLIDKDNKLKRLPALSYISQAKVNLLPWEPDIFSIQNSSVPFPECSIGYIYFLLNDYLDIIYVGQSVNLTSRLTTHRRSIPFTRFSWIECDVDKLNDTEAFYIVSLKPKYNKSLPPNSEYKTLKAWKSEIWNWTKIPSSKVTKRLVDKIGITPSITLQKIDYYERNDILSGIIEYSEKKIK